MINELKIINKQQMSTKHIEEIEKKLFSEKKRRLIKKQLNNVNRKRKMIN